MRHFLKYFYHHPSLLFGSAFAIGCLFTLFIGTFIWAVCHYTYTYNRKKSNSSLGLTNRIVLNHNKENRNDIISRHDQVLTHALSQKTANRYGYRFLEEDEENISDTPSEIREDKKKKLEDNSSHSLNYIDVKIRNKNK